MVGGGIWAAMQGVYPGQSLEFGCGTGRDDTNTSVGYVTWDSWMICEGEDQVAQLWYMMCRTGMNGEVGSVLRDEVMW